MLKESGFSLVELMIALLLGSLLTIAATQLFLVNRQTENLQMGVASVQDNGRFAFDFISRSLMSAGLSPDEPIVPFILDGRQFKPASPERAEITDGDKYDAIALKVDGGKDCLGDDLNGYKRFHVLDDEDGKRLVCTSYEKTQVVGDDNTVQEAFVADDSGPLVDNVEAFQVLYGIDFVAKDDSSGAADLYTNASQVKKMQADFTSGRARVVSVRFSILLASGERVSLDPEFTPERILVLDRAFQNGDSNEASQINFGDGRLYRTYSSTVALRNVVSEI